VANSPIKGIVVYFVIAFGMAWVFWTIPMLMGYSARSGVFQLAILPGAFAPAVAAIVVRKWVTREGFADAGLRLNLRGNGSYYLAAWLLPAAVTAIIVILAMAFGVSRPDFPLERVAAATMPGVENPLLKIPRGIRFPMAVAQGLIVAIIATPVLWGEEFGWRGYLQVRLLARRPLLAAVATGLIWGVWHYPINLRGYNFPDNRILGLFLFPLWTVLLSIIFGWLRLRTGSTWAASLAHAATNAIGGSLTSVLFMGGPNWIWVSYAGILSWIPLGAVCAWIIWSGQLRPEGA